MNDDPLSQLRRQADGDGVQKFLAVDSVGLEARVYQGSLSA